MTYRLIVVEDDDEVRHILQTSLTSQGYAVTALASGTAAEAVLAQHRHDLALIDIGLDDTDGLTLTQRLRAKSDMGIIIVSAYSDMNDRIAGLDFGADDYIDKPFDLNEVHARIRSVLRRQIRQRRRIGAKRLHFDGWIYDGDSRTLRDGFGHTVSLTTGEYRLLEIFLREPRKILSRENLVAKLRGGISPYNRSIDVAIMRLRRKLGDSSATTGVIKTVRGGGYIFVARVQALPATQPAPADANGTSPDNPTDDTLPV